VWPTRSLGALARATPTRHQFRAGRISLVARANGGAEGRCRDRRAGDARQGRAPLLNGADNGVHRGDARLPFEATFVVISNGVIDLIPDKDAVFSEIYRVLVPGGRIQIADVTIQRPVSEEGKKNIDLWTG
jgi:SAM-dependent methyltransferase